MPLNNGSAAPEETSLLLHPDVAALARTCADSLQKTLLHYQGEDAWEIGSLPLCAPLADTLENRVRALLSNTHLPAHQVSLAGDTLKTIGDLRAVSRASRQATQLYWLMREADTDCGELGELVKRVGEVALVVAQLSAGSLTVKDRLQLRNAALAYRDVDAACAEAEREITAEFALVRYAPTTRRIARAAIWCMAISGEGMARVAARSVAL